MSADYLVVGAGLFGATCARELAEAGQSVLVVEKRPHVAGTAHTEVRDGQLMQTHGGHIFHTNDEALWAYVNRFAAFKQYSHHVKAMVAGQVYSFPINRMTLQQVAGVRSREEAEQWLLEERRQGRAQLYAEEQAGTLITGKLSAALNDSARVWCLANLGPTLYARFIEGYTRKMWGCDPGDLPAAIVRRLPLRLTWDDHYFGDRFQGLPSQGYTAFVTAMLDHANIRVELNEDYLDWPEWWDARARRVIYTGAPDALLNYRFGRLGYRSLEFRPVTMPVEDFQGCATMNYPAPDVPYLRTEEWRHWWPPAGPGDSTWVTFTYPAGEGEPYYPIGNDPNRNLYRAYVEAIAAEKPHVRLGGRLGSFRYIDMHQAIAAALHLVRQELN